MEKYTQVVAKQRKIPFDSLALSAVTCEVQALVGGKLQRISQPAEHDLVLGVYNERREYWLLLTCDPVFARAHLVTKRPENPPTPPAFASALRARVMNASLRSVRQIGLDRILEIALEKEDGIYLLIAELMGKHSNLILVDPQGKIVSSAKTVGVSKSSRPVHTGRRYEPPPLPQRPPLTAASPSDDLTQFEGMSPFLREMIEAGLPLEEVQASFRHLESGCRGPSPYQPVLSIGHGAYPISLDHLDLPQLPRQSLSIALEQHFDQAIPAHRAAQLKQSLLGQLERVALAREVALSDLRQAEDAGARAGKLQLMGELILAYGPSLEPGAKELHAQDYEGNPLQIPLRTDQTYLENAQRYFDKAKKAKGAIGTVRDQIKRLQQDYDQLLALIEEVRQAERPEHLEELKSQALGRRWLHTQPAGPQPKEKRPYEGHKIRELMGPGGVTVLYGENATSNDYLTLRVAKPNDWWLHVRGGISAHVVIQTRNQPEKVGREALTFAAKIAVQNSPAKHSGYVPVDYTLKKYVRKPRGAHPGTALYTHEKTLHVEGKD
jgi:predicted ribosome quality control (RQC) complex YloA/Tae2 family protein